MKDGFIFTAKHEQLPPGYRALITTDGIIDQVGGPKKIAHGRKRLYKLLAEERQQSPREFTETLLARFAEWQGKQHRRDDVCFLPSRARLEWTSRHSETSTTSRVMQGSSTTTRDTSTKTYAARWRPVSPPPKSPGNSVLADGKIPFDPRRMPPRKSGRLLWSDPRSDPAVSEDGQS
jgi:hypothetical protein